MKWRGMADIGGGRMHRVLRDGSAAELQVRVVVAEIILNYAYVPLEEEISKYTPCFSALRLESRRRLA